MNKTRGRGRPAAATGLRAAILAVAHRRFLTEGYDAVTLRSIATEAGADVALISYHFGSKKGLFGECLALTVNPATALADVLANPTPDMPARILHTLLTAWDDPQQSAPLRRMIEAAITNPDVGRLFREVIEGEMVGPIAEHLHGRDATYRATAALSQLIGLIFLRYLVAAEPAATMRASDVVRYFEPGLRAALQPKSAPATRRGPRARPNS
jgi:AcrR family transcriptional regulator